MTITKLTARARADIVDRQFAFPAQRKEPLENASHVRNAIARFDQVQGVTDAERDDAWLRIQAAAKQYRVQVHEGGWRELRAGRATTLPS
jgi:phosphoribosylanthranilate isomerase